MDYALVKFCMYHLSVELTVNKHTRAGGQFFDCDGTYRGTMRSFEYGAHIVSVDQSPDE